MAPVFQCSHCSVLFANQRNLNRHQCNHNSSFWVSCKHCVFTTKRKDNLKRHSDKYHSSSSNNNYPETKTSTLPQTDEYQLLNKRKNKLPVSVKTTSPMEVLNANYSMKFDKRLRLPHNFIYAGATQSGKTTLLLKTLENATAVYNPKPSQIYFFHNCFQENYKKLSEKLHGQGIRIEFIKKPIVSETDLENMSDPNGGQTLVIIDDNSISAASSRDVAQVFTIARHKNCSIILLLHFIFGPWPSSRIISANTSYFFLLKSPRMRQQVSTLGLQLGKQNDLLSAYARISQQPYGYVLVDLRTNTPDNFRIRTDVIVTEEEKYNKNTLKVNDSDMVQTPTPKLIKAQNHVTYKLEKKWIQCSDHMENNEPKKTNHKRNNNKYSRDAKPCKNFDISIGLPFVNMYRSRPYI